MGQQSGTVTLEFALVVPVMLFLMLLLAQTTFALTGNLFVHYAAFAAVRSAMVHIPADYSPSEPPNVIDARPGSPKYDAIRAAAAIAVMPVAGRLDEGQTQLRDALAEHFTAYGRTAPRWARTLIADRASYAEAHTQVTILHTHVGGGDTIIYEDAATTPEPFGYRAPVTVRVRHRLNLSVPLVWTLFADADGQRWRTIEAQYTLTNEGIPTALPPPPPWPREP